MANVMFLIDFLHNKNIHPLREVTSVFWHRFKNVNEIMTEYF